MKHHADTLLEQVQQHCEREPAPDERGEWESRLLELAMEIKRVASVRVAAAALDDAATSPGRARVARAQLEAASQLVAASRQSLLRTRQVLPPTHEISPSE